MNADVWGPIILGAVALLALIRHIHRDLSATRAGGQCGSTRPAEAKGNCSGGQPSGCGACRGCPYSQQPSTTRVLDEKTSDLQHRT